jgi:hypothetical protein
MERQAMQFQPDIAISDRTGSPIAIIEVKALKDASVRNATRYLRNLLSHGIAPRVRYVMLITPTAGYVWTSPNAVLEEATPALSFSIERIIRHYLPSEEPDSVRDLVLEAIARQWLWDLTDGIEVDPDVTDRLRGAGLLSAVRDGEVSAPASV